MAYVILICDDDADIRSAMKRTLRGNIVVETTSPDEALEALKHRTFDAIVSDYSIEATSNGLELLQHVRLQYPNTIRFLVTGNQDMDIVVQAVNEGAVHRYFRKPWDDEKLRTALDILLRSRNRTDG